MDNIKFLFGKILVSLLNKIMKPTFLKVYFWFLLLAAVGGASFIFQRKTNIPAYSIDTVYCLLNAFALYAFTYRKKYFSLSVWKILFWTNCIYQLAYVVFQFFPNMILIKYLAVLSENGKPDSWWVFILNLAIFLPLLYTTYLLSKGSFLQKSKAKNKSSKNELSQKEITPQWGRFALITVITEINIFLGYVLLATLNVFGDSVTIYSNILVNYICLALFVAVPFVIYIFRLHQRKIQVNLLSIKMALILLLGIFISFSFLPKNVSQNDTGNITVGSLSSDDLMKAINKKRKENKVNELRIDDTTCILAKSVMDDLNKNGISVYGDRASFQREMDNAFGSDQDILDWYKDYLTYQETTEEAIKKWNATEDKDLFTSTKFKYGCAIVDNGFGVVIVGYNDPKPSPKKPLPSGVEPAGANYY